MPAPKPPYSLFLSVEGSTEKLYFEWLRDTINANQSSRRRVSLSCEKCSPLQFVKQVSILDIKARVFHVHDYEDPKTDPGQFTKILKEMRAAESSTGLKKFNYSLAYSNLTFDLWIMLHRADCYGLQTYSSAYWAKLQSAYGLTAQSFNKYKKEDNYKSQVLDKLTLQCVRDAIERAEKIEQSNQRNGYVKQSYKKYEYYANNPSLSIHVPIKAMLNECGLL